MKRIVILISVILAALLLVMLAVSVFLEGLQAPGGAPAPTQVTLDMESFRPTLASQAPIPQSFYVMVLWDTFCIPVGSDGSWEMFVSANQEFLSHPHDDVSFVADVNGSPCYILRSDVEVLP